MEKKEFVKALEAVVADYLESELQWGDSPMVEVDPSKFSVRVVTEEENPELDYYDMMDLLTMSVDNPGQWEADGDAIDSVADSYFS